MSAETSRERRQSGSYAAGAEAKAKQEREQMRSGSCARACSPAAKTRARTETKVRAENEGADFGILPKSAFFYFSSGAFCAARDTRHAKGAVL